MANDIEISNSQTYNSRSSGPGRSSDPSNQFGRQRLTNPGVVTLRDDSAAIARAGSLKQDAADTIANASFRIAETASALQTASERQDHKKQTALLEVELHERFQDMVATAGAENWNAQKINEAKASISEEVYAKHVSRAEGYESRVGKEALSDLEAHKAKSLDYAQQKYINPHLAVLREVDLVKTVDAMVEQVGLEEDFSRKEEILADILEGINAEVNHATMGFEKVEALKDDARFKAAYNSLRSRGEAPVSPDEAQGLTPEDAATHSWDRAIQLLDEDYNNFFSANLSARERMDIRDELNQRRDTALKDHREKVAKDESEYKERMYDAKVDFSLGLREGYEPTEKEIKDRMDSGDIDKDTALWMLETRDRHMKDIFAERAERELGREILDDPNQFLDMGNKEAVNAVDSVVKKLISSPDFLMKPIGEQHMEISMHIESSGPVPSAMSRLRKDLLNEETANSAAATYKRISENPNVGWKVSDKHISPQMKLRVAMLNRGRSWEDVNRTVEAYNTLTPEQKTSRKDEFGRIKKNEDFLEGLHDEFNVDRITPDLKLFYQEAYRDNYIISGEEELAHEMAIQRVKEQFAESGVNGRKEYTRMPPELITGLSTEELRIQAHTDLAGVEYTEIKELQKNIAQFEKSAAGIRERIESGELPENGSDALLLDEIEVKLSKSKKRRDELLEPLNGTGTISEEDETDLLGEDFELRYDDTHTRNARDGNRGWRVWRKDLSGQLFPSTIEETIEVNGEQKVITVEEIWVPVTPENDNYDEVVGKYGEKHQRELEEQRRREEDPFYGKLGAL